MKNIPNDEKREYGELINEYKKLATDKLDLIEKELESRELNEKLSGENIDVTLSSTNIKVGAIHPLEKLTEHLEELFISLGYDVVEGPEVETDKYNFEMLNLPIGHPSRDAQDTFYVKDSDVLLRSHTSPVQIRTMLENNNKTGVRIICPGKTYRRDNDDATHSHQFSQIEGLVVDKDVSLANLKYTFDIVASVLFGDKVITRFRPSYYPFTEPSVEMDISCFNCGSKGCNVCKNTGWITVGGAGMVHPNVLNNCGYDTNVYTGFAFGFGIERLAMLKYGIKDVREFYINDLRSKLDFARRDA
jgi:phenylalanyl-tRNA synthetase alpha chain